MGVVVVGDWLGGGSDGDWLLEGSGYTCTVGTVRPSHCAVTTYPSKGAASVASVASRIAAMASKRVSGRAVAADMLAWLRTGCGGCWSGGGADGGSGGSGGGGGDQ